jgi:uncharacterized protein involved in exopolysaccharide biosynthesis
MALIEIDSNSIPLLEAPETNKEAPRRYVTVLFKYKRLIRTIFLSIAIPAFLLTFLLPTKYTGTVKIFIKPSRAFLSFSPTTSDNALTVAPSLEALNSEIQIMKSKELLRQLAKELPFPDKGMLADGSPFAIEANPVKATNIITLSLTSTNPRWAAQVVNRAAELYQEAHLKVRRTQGIEKFYDEQERRLRDDLLKAEQDLKDFQQREGIVDAAKEVDSSLSSLAVVERNLKDTESGIRETEKRIGILEEQLKSQQATISTTKQVTVDPVYNRIRERLTQLELEKENLLQRYLPNDRLVVEKQREISDLKKRLEEVNKTSVGSENIGLNEVHRRILNELLSARVQLQALREKRNSEIGQVASYSTTAAGKKRMSYEYDRLQQTVNAKKEALGLYKKKSEEARISDAMDEQKIGNAYILEKATMPLPRAGRSVFIWGIMIAILSLGVAIGTAFAVNYLDPTVQDEINVEDETGLPVLATIQHYGTELKGL